MIRALVEPTSRLLMTVESVRVRLGLPTSANAVLTSQVTAASDLVARYLRFEPCYTTWEQTVLTAPRGESLYLDARPAWSITSVVGANGADPGGWRLDRGPLGESWLWRPATWRTVEPTFGLGTGSPPAPAVTIQFTAGWWLPGMTGSQPPGVDALPPGISEDFLRVVQYVRAAGGSNPFVRRMRNEGAEVEFFDLADVDRDPETGLPSICTLALSSYRRPL